MGGAAPQASPNLRRKRKVLSGLEGLLKILGLEVTVEGVRAVVLFSQLSPELDGASY